MNKVFCMNSKCVNYIEDGCEKAYRDETHEVDEDGKCAHFKEGENEFYLHAAKIKPLESRKCSHCGKEMSAGYCIRGGEEYYCSDNRMNDVKQELANEIKPTKIVSMGYSDTSKERKYPGIITIAFEDGTQRDYIKESEAE